VARNNPEKWKTRELRFAKFFGRTLVLYYEAYGGTFNEAVQEWLRLLPWVPDEYIKHAHESLTAKEIKKRLRVSSEREENLTTRRRQLKFEPAIDELMRCRLPWSFEMAVVKTTNLPEVVVSWFVYTIPAYTDKDRKILDGYKFGITSAPKHRWPKHAYDFRKKDPPLYMDTRPTYCTEIGTSEKIARQVEKLAIAKAFPGVAPSIGEEYFKIASGAERDYPNNAIWPVMYAAREFKFSGEQAPWERITRC
jgi:hypothetical protein